MFRMISIGLAFLGVMFNHDVETSAFVVQGTERVRETPYQVVDQTFGGSFAIFKTESSANADQKSYLYVAPLCRLVPLDATGRMYKMENLGNGSTKIVLNMLYYHEGMFEQALKYVTNLKDPKLDSKDKPSLLQISVMEHRLEDFPDVKPVVSGEGGGRYAIPESMHITFDVPTSQAELATRFADGPVGLKVRSKYYYNALEVAVSVEAWTISDVRATEAFKTIDGGGANFVSAKQVADIVQEVSRNLKLSKYSDPTAESKLDTKSKQIFDQFLQRTADLVIDDAKKADEADEQLRKGSGLELKDYQPVRLEFDYTKDVLSVDRVEEANQKANEYFEQKQSSLGVSMKGNYGGVMGSVSGKAHYDMSSNKWKHEAFSSQKEFENFKKQHNVEAGKGIRYSPRGLNLVDKSEFKSKIELTASEINVRPMDKTNTTVGYSSTVDAKEEFGRIVALESANRKAIDSINARLGGETFPVKTVYFGRSANEVEEVPVDLGVAEGGSSYLLLVSVGASRPNGVAARPFKIEIGEDVNGRPQVALVTIIGESSVRADHKDGAAPDSIWDSAVFSVGKVGEDGRYHLLMKKVPAGNGRAVLIKN